MLTRSINSIALLIMLMCPAKLCAQDEGPLHLVVSKVGNSMVTYTSEGEVLFTLMAEIGGSLGFSLNGDFAKAEIIRASTVAPDGNSYQLETIGEQPPARPGNVMRFLHIVHGDAHTGFSIGKWKVTVEFKVDGEAYTHEADYLVTWRKPNDGIWGMQRWANESATKQDDTDKPATATNINTTNKPTTNTNAPLTLPQESESEEDDEHQQEPVVPEFIKVEEHGGWLRETSSLKHRVRLNRLTWIEDPSIITYRLFIDGKNLWTIEINGKNIFFTPVRIDRFQHVSSHVNLNAPGRLILDLMTPDHTGYIASIAFHSDGKVTLATTEGLEERASLMNWTHLSPFTGSDFSDPKSVYRPRLPTP